MNLHCLIRRGAVPVLLLLGLGRLHATLPEPDNVIYGSIVIGTNVVRSTSTNVVVEVRRTPTGAALASYRMGANPGFGDYYSVNVTLESLDPNSIVNPGLIATNASAAGDALYLVVRDRNVVRYTTNLTVGDKGTFQRIDFGTAVAASPIDQWQQFYLGMAGVNMGTDPTGKGQSLLADYIAGTDPNDSNSLFRVNIQRNPATEVSFFGIRAEGAGYAGMTRFYALEYSTNLTASSWLGVPGQTNLPGNNQTILYTAPTNGVTGPFYRARVWLQGP